MKVLGADPRFDHLAQPIQIGHMTVENRLVVLPTYKNLATEGGYVTPRILDIYRSFGEGGWGLVTIEVTCVHPLGRVFMRGLGLWQDDMTVGFSELAEAIHAGGISKAIVQLLHGGWGARFTGQLPLSVCANPRKPEGEHLPSIAQAVVGGRWREMTPEDIEEIIEAYGEAAVRAKRAGFDGVELHCANGFPLGYQFLSPLVNRRQDIWGQDRMLFVERTLGRIREKVGPSFALGIRINADDIVGDQGITMEDNKSWIPRFEAAGVDYISIIQGAVLFAPDFTMPTIYFPGGCVLPLIRELKQVARVPVIAAGKINDPLLAEKVVENGDADMVGMGRAAHCDPMLPRKTFDGRHEEVRKCIYCDLGCFQPLQDKSMLCTQNYALGRNREEYEMTPAPQRKRVLVVGGGVAGMEAARVAALRGHRVSLYEKEPRVGGAVVGVAANIPRVNTRDLNNAVEWLSTQLHRMSQDGQLRVELGVSVTPELVETLQPDVVIVATGSAVAVPEVPGIRNPNVFTIDEFLREGTTPPGSRVVVWGGGYGSELALSLARQGKEVTLVEESEQIAVTPFLDGNRRFTLLRLLRESEPPIRTLTGRRVVDIGANYVQVADPQGREERIEADAVVLALGRRPDRSLVNALRGKVEELYGVGDVERPENMMHSVHSAHKVALEI